MLRAHTAAVRALRSLSGAPPVGIVLNLPVFDPARASRADRAVAAAQDWAFNGVLLAALERGLLLPPLAARPRRVEHLARSFDWLGLNYYGRFVVRFDPRRASELFGERVSEHDVKTPWTDWGQVYPEGLARQLVRLARHRVPLYVTENGIFDNDDSERPSFIQTHVRAVHRAIAHGANVRGYFHWSLIDNFEWAEGWSTHFGLIELDRATQARRPRRSADVYAAICRANAVEA
jgi:beta-glucosidase